VEPLKVDHALTSENFPRKNLEVVAGKVEDLSLDVQLVRDGDLTLIPTLHPSLACK
jgi:hypothetical protein